MFLHPYTWEDSGCLSEWVLGTCVDLIRGCLYVWNCWEEVERIKTSQRLCVCRLTFTITNRVFRLMSTPNIETYEFFPLILSNTLSERSTSNPKPDSFWFGGQSLCGVNLTSLPHVGLKSRIDFRCETNSPKTVRRVSSTPSYSPSGWPRGM